MASPGVSAKQFLSLGGVPILIHSVRAFAEKTGITSITLAVRSTEAENVRAQLVHYGFAEKVSVVTGGETRQDSVWAALQSLEAKDDDIVLVHDAVRPLIDAPTIDRAIDAIAKHEQPSPGCRLSTPLSRSIARPMARSLRPPCRASASFSPRRRRAHATPPLRRAFDDAAADSFAGTDEASLLERAGIAVAVVLGSASNFKITQPGDLELAKFYLDQRGAA